MDYVCRIKQTNKRERWEHAGTLVFVCPARQRLCIHSLTRLQLAILKWLLVVFDHIDDKEVLHNLYGVLFFFTEYDTLVRAKIMAPCCCSRSQMPHVCHLLYLLTRRQDGNFLLLSIVPSRSLLWPEAFGVNDFRLHFFHGCVLPLAFVASHGGIRLTPTQSPPRGCSAF